MFFKKFKSKLKSMHISFKHKDRGSSGRTRFGQRGRRDLDSHDSSLCAAERRGRVPCAVKRVSRLGKLYHSLHNSSSMTDDYKSQSLAAKTNSGRFYYDNPDKNCLPCSDHCQLPTYQACSKCRKNIEKNKNISCKDCSQDDNNNSHVDAASVDGSRKVRRVHTIPPRPRVFEPRNLSRLSRASFTLKRFFFRSKYRQIEADAKSLNSFSNHSGHSRKSSDTSQISLVSGTSSSQERDRGVEEDEDAWNTWSNIINDWDHYYKKKNAHLKELVRKGIPHHFRTIVWQYLCGAMDSDVKKLYKEYINQTSACEKVIRRDIARTYPEHDFFKEKDGMGQESLFNVMKAYSLQDREVGYCQGSGFIVGLLLMQMPEEEAFAIFVKIMQDYKMRDMFKPSMAQLGLCMYQLENLVQELLPELHCHFQAQSFHTSMYASSWFLTLFTTALALPTAYRIMDVFLSEGMDVIFKVALALLGIGKEALLSLDMEGMLKYFQKELPVKADADPDGLMQASYKICINTKKMKKMEKEYTVMKTKEQEEMVELKRLRNENKLLRRKVELLEDESSELADRLVRGQVSRAEEEEITYVTQRELLALRHTHLETAHMLEVAQDEIRHLSTLLEANHNSCQSSMDEASLSREKLHQREDMIRCLQDELVKVRLTVAESDALVRDLRGRIEDLEEEKKTLRESTVDNSVAHLQEELIAVKLREAEANLSLKDLKQSVSELNAAWLKHLQERKPEPAPAPDSTPKKIGNLLNWNSSETQRLEEELMSTRLREMEAVTELKQLRLKVMELETQVQVSGNQLKRQDEDNKAVADKLETAQARVKELTGKLKEQQHKYSDLESKIKDEQMTWKIREAEHTQAVAELTQKISRLETKNEEMVAEGELRYNSLSDSDQVRDLQDKVADMKAELLLSPTTPDVEPWKWLQS